MRSETVRFRWSIVISACSSGSKPERAKRTLVEKNYRSSGRRSFPRSARRRRSGSTSIWRISSMTVNMSLSALKRSKSTITEKQDTPNFRKKSSRPAMINMSLCRRSCPMFHRCLKSFPKCATDGRFSACLKACLILLTISVLKI